VVITSASRERTTLLIDFFNPNGNAHLEPCELIREILIPLSSAMTASQFMKFGNRHGMVTAIVNVAVRLSMDQSHSLRDARIALGAYAAKPLRIESLENSLIGHSIEDASIESLTRAAVTSYPARDDQFAGAEYRQKLATTLIIRALHSICSDLKRMDFDG
jgi:CO/xanthine dehydrogenase FAD-binding subunit